jgi:hypothetical protein
MYQPNTVFRYPYVNPEKPEIFIIDEGAASPCPIDIQAYLSNFEPFSRMRPLPTMPPAKGDWLQRFIPGSLFGHDGIVTEVFSVEGGYFTGRIAHSMPGVGVEETDDFAFSKGGIMLLKGRAESPAQVQAIMQRVEQSLGHPYYLIEANCQHFASYAFTGKAESESVNAVAGLATVAAAVALFANRGRGSR